MSDSSISIVPRLSKYPDKEQKSKEILSWLIAKDIVKPVLSDCTLGAQYGYAISEGAKQIVIHPKYLPFGLITNGLDIITERQVFHTGEYFIDKLICPNCNKNIVSEDWELNIWFTAERDDMKCPLCEHSTQIHAFKFEPDWGFSDFGFTFWNWPEFTSDFINDFRKLLNCEISIVYCRI